MLPKRSLKIFLKASDDSLETINNKNAKNSRFDNNINEAKNIYDEITVINKCPTIQPKRSVKLYSSDNPTLVKISSEHVAEKSKNPLSINQIFKAAENGDLQFIKNNINKSNVNICDSFGWTLLMSCSYLGHKQLVKYLLDIGADTKVKNYAGLTAMDLASKKGNFQIIDLFYTVLQKNHSRKLCKRKDINLKITENTQEIMETKSKFFCAICNQFFKEITKSQHESSTIHIFNTAPKINTYYSIPKNNRGYQIMLNKGWDENHGLGLRGDGLKYPVKTTLKRDRKGIGQPTSLKPRISHFSANDPNAIKNVRPKRNLRNERLKQLREESHKDKILRMALS